MSHLFDELELEPEPSTIVDVVGLGPVAVPTSLAEALDAAGAELALEPPQPLLAPQAVVEVMPPEFNLPALVQFVPNAALRVSADALAAEALAIDVTVAGGVQRADAVLVNLRGAIKGAEAHFEDPTSRANRVHKWLTTTLGTWLSGPRAAAATVGKRIVDEQIRQDAVAARSRVDAQALADQQARENAGRAAEAADKALAPPEVVEKLKQEARTGSAPPVSLPTAAPLKSTTVAKSWKARFAGTTPGAEHHPLVKDLTDAQRLQLIELLKDVIAGRAPIAVLKELNWSYMDDLAVGEQSGLGQRIHGIEAFEYVAPKAKPVSRKA